MCMGFSPEARAFKYWPIFIVMHLETDASLRSHWYTLGGIYVQIFSWTRASKYAPWAGKYHFVANARILLKSDSKWSQWSLNRGKSTLTCLVDHKHLETEAFSKIMLAALAQKYTWCDIQYFQLDPSINLCPDHRQIPFRRKCSDFVEIGFKMLAVVFCLQKIDFHPAPTPRVPPEWPEFN